jgi:hypothetical protein
MRLLEVMIGLGIGLPILSEIHFDVLWNQKKYFYAILNYPIMSLKKALLK